MLSVGSGMTIQCVKRRSIEKQSTKALISFHPIQILGSKLIEMITKVQNEKRKKIVVCRIKIISNFFR